MGRTVPPPPHKNKQQNPQLLNLGQSKPRVRERTKKQRRKMTQKANLFKGQQKKKSVPPNRHGKPSVTRKGNYLALRVCVFVYGKVRYSMCICFFLVCAGKRFVKPAKVTKEMDVDRVCPIFYSLSKYYFYFFFYKFLGVSLC